MPASGWCITAKPVYENCTDTQESSIHSMIFKQDNDRQTGKGQYLTLTLIKHEIHDILSFMSDNCVTQICHVVNTVYFVSNHTNQLKGLHS